MDNDDLIELFSKLKDKTCEAIKVAEEEEYDKLDTVMKARAEIIENIKLLKCSKDELRNIYDKFDISQFENKLHSIMSIKAAEIKLKMAKTVYSDKAGKNYNSYFQNKSVIFSKKV